MAMPPAQPPKANPESQTRHAQPPSLLKNPGLYLCYDPAEAQDLALQLFKDLSQKGYHLHTSRLPGTQKSEEETPLTISQCSAFILLLTPQAVSRPGGTCLAELDIAHCSNRIIIPVMAYTCHLPLSLYRSIWLDFRNWQGPSCYQQAFAQLTALLETSLRDVPPSGAAVGQLFSTLAPLDFSTELACARINSYRRQHLFAALESWLKDPNSRVFILSAPSGTGVTTWMAQLLQQHPQAHAYHAFKPAWRETFNPYRFIPALAAQLLTQLDSHYKALNRQVESLANRYVASPLDLLHRLLTEPLKAIKVDKPILILLDSLEASLTAENDKLATLLSQGLKETPEWLRVVISTTSNSTLEETFGEFNPTLLEITVTENSKDIRSYLEEKFQSASFSKIFQAEKADPINLTAHILRKCQGSFRYVDQVLKGLQSGYLNPTHPENLPEDLAACYLAYFGSLLTRQEFENIRPQLEVIIASGEPLNAVQLAYLTNSDQQEIEKILGNLADAFPARQGRYHPSHNLLVEWLSGVNDPNRVAYRLNSSVGHRRLAEANLAILRQGEAKTFTLAYLPHHLLNSQNVDELVSLLLNFKFIFAKCAAGMWAELIADYTEALKAAQVPSNLKEHLAVLWLLRSALELARHQVRDDIHQLPGQLIGRLSTFENTAGLGNQLHILLDAIRAWRDAPWLYPLTPILLPPGGTLLHNLSDHNNKITALAMTPDGQYLILATENGALQIWDIELGIAIHNLQAHSQKITALAITPDSRQVITASADRTIRVWEVVTGHELKVLHGHAAQVTALVLSPDGKYLISGASDHNLKIWDLTKGNEVRTLPGHTAEIERIIVTPNGCQIISAAADKTIRIWEMGNGKLLQTLRGHQSIITLLTTTPDGQWIVSSSFEDHSIKVWDIESGKPLYSLRGHNSFISDLAFSADGHYAVSASGDYTLKVWDFFAGTELHSLKGHNSHVRSVCVSPDGRLVISGSGDKTVRVWELESGRLLRTFQGHNESVNTLLLRTDGGRLATASSDGTVKVWDISTLYRTDLPESLTAILDQQSHTPALPKHSGRINALAITPHGRLAISAASDCTLKVWKVESGKELHTLRSHAAPVMSVALTPDGRWAISAADGIRIWDIEKGVVVQSLALSEWFGAVNISPDGRWIFAGGGEHTLRVWELDSWRELGHLGTPNTSLTQVCAIAIAPNKRHIISAATDKTIKVWDLRRGCELFTRRGHADSIEGVAISPDSLYAVSASADTTLKVWHLAQGSEVSTLRGHTAAVHAATFSPDGKLIFSVSADSTVRVWELYSGKTLAVFSAEEALSACAIAPDGTTLLIGGESGRLIRLRLQKPNASKTQ